MNPGRVRRLRQAAQVACFVLFCALLLAPAGEGAAAAWTNLFVRLDPLLMAAGVLGGRAWLPGAGLALLTLTLTLVFGRVWCGWVCPLGTLLDWIGPRKNKKMRLRPAESRRVPEGFRKVKTYLFLLVLGTALFGSQVFLFLDPITIAVRSFSSAVIPAFGQGIDAAEGVLYAYPPLYPLLDAIHAGVVYPLFRDVRPHFQQAVPVALLLGAVIGLNWITERFWCRYLCPLGGMLGLVARFAWLRREVLDECNACAICTPDCPMGTINPQDNYRSDAGECIVCYDCVSACRNEGAVFSARKNGWDAAPQQPYDLTRREALTAFGGAVAAAALLTAEPVRTREPAVWLRPPGGRRTDFDALCLRCGACVRVCPTQGLQPLLLGGGWQNLFTPVLVPRLGACTYACNLCSQACPSGAIPAQTLEEKQITPIGLARIDRDRCLPWVYDTPCIVCEEACPLPQKAIRLVEVEASGGSIQKPEVIKDLCIGCGICEYQCPMGGEAAIRVFTYTEVSGPYASAGRPV